MSTASKSLEDLVMLKELTGVCPLIIVANRDESDDNFKE